MTTDKTTTGPPRVGVYGAGTMGAAIAEWLALGGFGVILVSRREEPLRAFLDSVGRHWALKVRLGRMSDEARAERLRGCLTSRTVEALAEADVMIECAAEDLVTKREVFRALATVCPEKTLLASNTSSLRITDISRPVPRAHRIVGMHFFQPVRFTRVVEVVPGRWTSAEACAEAINFLNHAEKVPILVKETPGFLVNRMAGAYLAEAMHAVDEGVVTPARLDEALKAWGMGIGPFELADLIGLDLLQAIARNMEEAYGARFHPGPLLDELVRAGRLGRKVGRGIYEYGPRGVPASGAPTADGGGGDAGEAGRRVVASLVEEAVTCLRDGIASADAIDLAAIECLRMPRGPLAIAGMKAAAARVPPPPRVLRDQP